MENKQVQSKKNYLGILNKNTNQAISLPIKELLNGKELQKNIIGAISIIVSDFQDRLSINLKMNAKSVEYCAESFINTFSFETINDLKECLERAANGNYGELWKIDQPTIFLWFKTYLEEKYEQRELKLTKEKKERLDAGRNQPILPIPKDRLKKLRALRKELEDKSRHHNGTIGSILRNKLGTDDN